MKLSPRQIENAVFSLIRERGPMDRFAVHASLPHIAPDALDFALRACVLARLLSESGGMYAYPLHTSQVLVHVHTCSNARRDDGPDEQDADYIQVELPDTRQVVLSALRTRSPLELAWGGQLA